MLAKREGMGPFCVLLMADSRAERAAEPSLEFVGGVEVHEVVPEFWVEAS